MRRPTRYIFALMVLCWSIFLIGQEKVVIDSLYKSAATGSDTSQIKALNELSLIFSETDSQKALEIGFNSLNKAKKAGLEKFIAYSLNRVGSVYDYKSMPDSAMLYYQEAMNIFERTGDRGGMASVYQNIGVLYYFQDEFPTAIQNYEKALAIRLQTGEEKYISKLYNNIGAVLRRQKKYDEAIVYYKKALALKQKLKDKAAMAGSFQNIAVAYEYKMDFEKAMEFMNKAIAINAELKNYGDLSANYTGITQLYIDLKNFKEATRYAKMAVEKALESEMPDKLYNAYEVSWVMDTLNKDFKSAMYNLYEARKYKDKIFNKEKTSAIEKLRLVYETDKKDNEIKLLNIENETKRRQERQLYIIIALISLLFLLLVVFYFKKQKDNQVLSRQKQEIIDKTEQLKQQAEEIARHRSQMNPHFLFNALNSLLGYILKNDTEKSVQQLNSLSKLLRQTLNNSIKEFISLEEETDYLKNYVMFEMERFETEIALKINIENEIDSAATGIPPMLIQPIIENCLKHAGLNSVKDPCIQINIFKKDEKLHIKVEDNGTGLKSVQGQEGRGTGILKARIEEINKKYGNKQFVNLTYTNINTVNQKLTGTICEFEIPFIDLY